MTREEVIKWFRESALYHKDHEPFNMAIEALEQEPKTGHWIVELKENVTEYIAGTGCRVFICSVCREWQDKRSSYCPVCGTKMVEPQESEGV